MRLKLGLAILASCLWACDGDTTTSTTAGTGGAGGASSTGGDSQVGGSGGTGGSSVGGSGGDGGSGGGEVGPTLAAGGVDLLLVVDNSRGMASKQEILANEVPSLVGSLLNPRCIDSDGIPAEVQPADGSEECPAETEREFPPVSVLNVGVISTSLGGHGADACAAQTTPSENDQAHLLARLDPDGSSQADTYADAGFLAWDPDAKHDPPGEVDQGGLETTLAAMLGGVGNVGCGYEAQLESWYRFLIQPDPHLSIEVMNDTAELVGVDEALLEQRALFVRPESVVIIALLTDENDCSTRDGSQYYFANQIYNPGTTTPYHLPKPRAACAIDPTDPCCRSCGQTPGAGCDESDDDCDGALQQIDDHVNLRCFEQKRRFGIDFHNPIERYVTGLTETMVPDRDGNLVANPLFAGGRTPDQVFLTGVLGVPWQDVMRRDGSGAPDPTAGLNGDGKSVGGYQSAGELVDNDTWDLILGDPEGYIDAADPLMVESIEPRAGSNPITGDDMEPTDAGYLANPINGHEYSIALNSDLQHACLFKLPTPLDCSQPNVAGCACTSGETDDPRCQDDQGDYGTTQYFARALPARRQLAVLKGVGDQGVVASICPVQLDDDAASTYGFRPAFGALAEALRPALE